MLFAPHMENCGGYECEYRAGFGLGLKDCMSSLVVVESR
jgi:hypothetical protein